MALVADQKFSTFQDGGDLAVDDIIVGLRGGLNTRFNFTGEIPAGVVVPIANGGTGATTATGARTNLGLGTMAVQNASAVAITGGTLAGVAITASTAALTSGSVAAVPSAGADIANKTYVDSMVGGSVASVSGTANRITSTGGINPVIDISAAYVGQTSITTLGTITTGIWQGTLVSPQFGGTGVNNGPSTLTMAGSHVLSGAFTSTFTFTNTTNVTFPVSGTLLTSSSAVTSITGTSNQVIASASTGAVTLSLPQSIATTSDMQFNSVRFNALNAIRDANGNNIINLTSNASPVNNVFISNAATGTAPTILASGTDLNVLLFLSGTGTSGVQVQGCSTNSNAIAGNYGEFQTVSVTSASKVTLTTATAANITSLSLGAGDWDISWGLSFETAATTSVTIIRGGISLITATVASSTATASQFTQQWAAFVPGITTFQDGGARSRQSLSATTTIYLNAQSTFTISNMFAYGWMSARRVR